MQLLQFLHSLQVLWRQSQGLFICVQSYRQCLVWSVCPWWGRGVCETDRGSAGGRRTERQTGWLVLSAIDCAPVLARHSIHMVSFTNTAILIQNLHPAFTEGLLAASHLSLNISQETYRQIRTWNRNMAQWVLDCSGRGTGRMTCVKNKRSRSWPKRGRTFNKREVQEYRQGGHRMGCSIWWQFLLLNWTVQALRVRNDIEPCHVGPWELLNEQGLNLMCT